MADAPKKPTDNAGEKPSTPAAVEAAGAKAKLEADSKPDTPSSTSKPDAASSTSTDKLAGSGTSTDKPADPAAAPSGAGADKDKPAGEKPGAEKTDKPAEEAESTASWLYDQTLGKVDSLDEIKGLFGLGKKTTASDKQFLASVQVHDPANKGAKLGADGKPLLGADGKPLPLDAPASAALDAIAKPGDLGKAPIKEAGSSNLFDFSNWNFNFSDSLSKIGTAITDTAMAGYDWMTDWYDSAKPGLTDLDAAKQNAKSFNTATENQVLTKGTNVTQEQAEQTLSSKLPPGKSSDEIRDMLEYGFTSDKVTVTYNSTDGSSKYYDPETGARRTVNSDGSASLFIPGDGKGQSGVRVNEDVNGNISWMFNDGVLKEGSDSSTFVSSFGDWQKQQIAASKEISGELRGLVAKSERDDLKLKGSVDVVDRDRAADIATKLLGDQKFDGQPLSTDQIRQFLKDGLPGGKTEIMNTPGHEGTKVQDVNGVKRIESPDGKTVTVQLPDGTLVVQNDKGTTWKGKNAEGKPDILVESADGKRFEHLDGLRVENGFRRGPGQTVDNTDNKRVAEIISDKFKALTEDPNNPMTAEQALEQLAKEQFIGGARKDTDGQRRAGFLQQIDGQWYQVNSNGHEIHLREVKKGADGQLEFGDQFSYNKDAGGWVGVDGKPYTGTGPKFKAGTDGAVVIGDNGGLNLTTTPDGHLTVKGALHSLTSNGDGTSQFDTAEHGNEIKALVAPRVDMKMSEEGKVVQEAQVGPNGEVTGTLINVNPETKVITTPQAEITPDGDTRVPGLGGMQFKANGDILSADGKSIYNASSHSWAADSGIIGGGEFHGMTRTEAARIMSDANAASGKAISIGSLALSIAKSGNPNALGIMRSLAWAGIAIADAGIAAANGFSPAVISLSLSKSVNFAALNVSDHQSRALGEVTRLGIFDSTTQNQAMIAGSFGSTYITPESAARHFVADRRPDLKVVA